MSLLPVIIIAAGLVGIFLLSRRNRQRAATHEGELRETIHFGTEVMTTSGLYGTVVGINDDDTVQLSIAPGIEVKWAFAALRDVASLPPRYRQDTTSPDPGAGEGGDGGIGGGIGGGTSGGTAGGGGGGTGRGTARDADGTEDSADH